MQWELSLKETKNVFKDLLSRANRKNLIKCMYFFYANFLIKVYVFNTCFLRLFGTGSKTKRSKSLTIKLFHRPFGQIQITYVLKLVIYKHPDITIFYFSSLLILSASVTLKI